MQSFKILINNRYTAATQIVTATTESIGLDNDYYVYNVSNGGGMVDFSNVRGYLNDKQNAQITNDFFAYLTGNTTTSQALNILGSDEKLSSVFNDYYQRIVLSSVQISNTAVIQQNLTGSTQIVGHTYNHLWNGYAPSNQLTGITKSINNSSRATKNFNVWQEFTREESYYVPVYIQRSNNQLSRYTYDFCDTVISSKTARLYPEFSAYTQSFIDKENANALNYAIWILVWGLASALSVGFGGNPIPTPPFTGSTIPSYSDTLINCFVDLNLETDENIKTTLRTVTIDAVLTNPNLTVAAGVSGPTYILQEGFGFDLLVKLDGPASGLEKITLNSSPLFFFTANLGAAPGVDFSPNYFPIEIEFGYGETEKKIPFVMFNDNKPEILEGVELTLSKPIVCQLGNPSSATVLIGDS